MILIGKRDINLLKGKLIYYYFSKGSLRLRFFDYWRGVLGYLGFLWFKEWSKSYVIGELIFICMVLVLLIKKKLKNGFRRKFYDYFISVWEKS